MKKEMIQNSVHLWRGSADVLLDKADRIIASHFSVLCKQHFKQYRALCSHVRYVTFVYNDAYRFLSAFI